MRTKSVILLAIVCFLTANLPLPEYREFFKLEWRGLVGFTSASHELRLDPSAAAEEHRAESAPFPLYGNILELQVAGNLPRHAEAALIGDGGKILSELQLPESESPKSALQWFPARFNVSSEDIGTNAHLRIRLKPPFAERHWLAVRDRADLYRSTGIAALEGLRPYQFPIELAGLLLLGILLAARPPPNRSTQFLIFFALACGFQLRTAPFYYWDEWHVLERFSQLGFPGVVYTHNEHFLPLFFSWYYVEAKLFGESYFAALIVSAFLHTINALMLTALLRRIGEDFPFVERAAFLLACCFTASALHAETLQWAFEQTILLSQIFTFGALICGWDFVKAGARRSAIITAACALAAPLCFGNGFSLGLQLAVVMLLALSGDFKPRALRLAVLLAAAAVFAGGAAALYKSHEVSTGHGVEKAKPFGDIAALGEYLAVGTQGGAILRGTGIFPKLAPEDAVKSIQKLGLESEGPLALMGLGGFITSLIIVALGALNTPRSGNAFRLYFAGQALLFACMILPALGRWQLGVGQSLSLRYHYSTLLGVAILALPAVVRMVSWQESRSKLQLVTPIFLVFFLANNYFAAKNFDYFTGQGYEHRLYAAQLADWESKLGDFVRDKPDLDYEANGTPLAGLYPIHRQTITPGRHPNQIYAVILWLQGH